jgi:hypothetical protein
MSFRQSARELDGILANERAEAIELKRRFGEEHGAIGNLLQSVQEAKLHGHWRHTRFNVFDVLGRHRSEEALSSFLAWVFGAVWRIPSRTNTFRGTGITAYLKDGGRLEQMTDHKSARTTGLYNRHGDDVSG